MIFRLYNQEDCEEILSLFFHTVHYVNQKDYTKDQLAAWAGNSLKDLSLPLWHKRFCHSYTLVAIEKGKIVGFGNLVENRYIDTLYVHSHFQGKKIATRLLHHFQKQAMAAKEPRLTANVSLTALPFFTKEGFSVLKKQTVYRQGIALDQYSMIKRLPS